MEEQIWLKNETRPIDEAVQKIEQELALARLGARKGVDEPATRGLADESQDGYIAVLLRKLIIHDNLKWFGGADIRVDALVVQGHGDKNDLASFYAPGTFRFSRVQDDEPLPIDKGLLLFYGQPRYFLDIFVTVSRDRADSDTLATLLSQQLQAPEVQTSLAALLGLIIAAPTVAAVTAAVGAAAVIGNLAYQVLKTATGATIGLYRTSWLEYSDNFGIGQHPKTGRFRVKDFSFQYEVVREEARPQ